MWWGRRVFQFFGDGQRLVTMGGTRMFGVLMTCMLTWCKRGPSPQKMVVLEALMTA